MPRIWDSKPKTKEELEAELKKIEDQKAIFELQIAVEEAAIALRDLYLQRLDDVVTLDDILDDAALKSLCGRISKLKTR
uniref:Uncharacterized protein n=1 Tax=viral metagenome TaxID=1070528 RepID=A0A6H1ZTT9_9ZZZZ